MEQIRDALGHSTVKITEHHYAQIHPDYRVDAREYAKRTHASDDAITRIKGYQRIISLHQNKLLRACKLKKPASVVFCVLMRMDQGKKRSIFRQFTQKI